MVESRNTELNFQVLQNTGGLLDRITINFSRRFAEECCRTLHNYLTVRLLSHAGDVNQENILC
jgi:hypothetical protein